VHLQSVSSDASSSTAAVLLLLLILLLLMLLLYCADITAATADVTADVCCLTLLPLLQC
jgi:hypothetical protein